MAALSAAHSCETTRSRTKSQPVANMAAASYPGDRGRLGGVPAPYRERAGM